LDDPDFKIYDPENPGEEGDDLESKTKKVGQMF